MRKNNLFFILVLWFLPLISQAQDVRSLKVSSDSIVKAYQKALDGVDFVYTQLVSNPTDYFTDDANELTGDTIWLHNYEDFKFYRIRTKGDLMQADFFTGKVGTIFEKEVSSYYFNKKRLLMTQCQFVRHGDALDDNVTNVFFEEKRVLFIDGCPTPMYIFREAEGMSDDLDINVVPFQQIDVRKIIYDKYLYETVGARILEGRKDI